MIINPSTLCSDSGQQQQPGLLHLLAERDDADELWEIALSRADCPINSRDAEGNTALMKAVAAGRYNTISSNVNYRVFRLV